jgi:hypothetical protein
MCFRESPTVHGQNLFCTGSCNDGGCPHAGQQGETTRSAAEKARRLGSCEALCASLTQSSRTVTLQSVASAAVAGGVRTGPRLPALGSLPDAACVRTQGVRNVEASLLGFRSHSGDSFRRHPDP